MKTDRLLADTKTIRYEETDLASLISAPYHFRCGIYLICTQGEAVVSTGVQKYIFNEQTELIFLTGGLLQVLETSGDLQVKMLMFPKEAFLNAMLPIDTPYFNYTHEHPCYHHTADERSQKTWRQINFSGIVLNSHISRLCKKLCSCCPLNWGIGSVNNICAISIHKLICRQVF